MLSALFLSACDDGGRREAERPAAPAARQEASNSATAGRIEAVAHQIGLAAANVVRAEQVQERIGDGVLGPSDVVTFTVFRMQEAALAAWSPKGSKRTGRPTYVSPKAMPNWVGRTDFEQLEFFDASALAPQSGWVGVARTRGNVYVFTATS